MVIHEKALTRVDQSAERHPAKQEVTGSPPGRGTCVCCMFNPQSGRTQETPDWCFPPSPPPSLPPALQISKQNLQIIKKNSPWHIVNAGENFAIDIINIFTVAILQNTIWNYLGGNDSKKINLCIFKKLMKVNVNKSLITGENFDLKYKNLT